jgi:hypothetical protein
MKNAVISLAIGAAALFASGANAAPLSNGLTTLPENGVQNVRLVCDDSGRCYRTPGARRVIVQPEYGDTYNYAPRYIERRGYYDRGYYNDGPSVGIGVGPGGVGIGFGTGPRW